MKGFKFYFLKIQSIKFFLKILCMMMKDEELMYDKANSKNEK